MEEPRNALAQSISRLLRPLVRILLRNGFSYGDFAEIAKRVFVDVAHREARLPGRKQSVSRVAIVTGLTRKDVGRLLKEDLGEPLGPEREYNRAARVLTGWVRDPRFHGPDGEPAPLPVEGEEGSFAALVHEHSGDMPVRAVLDELVRVGAVESTATGEVCLLSPAYIPSAGEVAKLHILGTDTRLLIETIDHNLRAAAPRFQRKVSYDNLPVEALPELRRVGGARAQALLEELDRYLAQHDRDANPQAQGEGRYQAGFGIYYFERNVDGEKHD